MAIPRLHRYNQAQITVRSGTQVISQSDILDTRLSDECGIVACIPEHVDTSTIFNQYHVKWQEVLQLMDAHEMDYSVWYEGFKSAAAAAPLQPCCCLSSAPADWLMGLGITH